MKKLIAIILTLVFVLSLASCGSKPEEKKADDKKMEQKEDKKEDAKEEMKEDGGTLKVGGTIYKFDDNFMSFVRRAIEKNAEGKIDIQLEDSQNDQAKQNEQVDLFLSKGVNALAINLVNPQAAATIIDKAKAKDIPVVFFNKEPSQEDMNSYDKCWYVGTTSSESGVMQGNVILESWQAHPEWDKNGDGVLQYVLLKGEPGHPDAEARTEYSIKVLTDAGIKVEELELQTGMWDSVKAKELMDTWLSKHGDAIEYVIANNDGMALGALNSLTGAGYFEGDKFMPIVGVDAIPDVLTQIEEGKIVGTVLNDAANQGRATVELSHNVAAGKDPVEGTEWKLDDTKAVRVPYVGITLDNIDVAKASYAE